MSASKKSNAKAFGNSRFWGSNKLGPQKNISLLDQIIQPEELQCSSCAIQDRRYHSNKQNLKQSSVHDSRKPLSAQTVYLLLRPLSEAEGST